MLTRDDRLFESATHVDRLVITNLNQNSIRQRAVRESRHLSGRHRADEAIHEEFDGAIRNGIVAQVFTQQVDVDRRIALHRRGRELDRADHSRTLVGLVVALLLVINGRVVVVLMLNRADTNRVGNLARRINV